MRYSWDDVPEDIKKHLCAFGYSPSRTRIPCRVGAQYDSEVVYHSIKESILQAKGSLLRHGNRTKEYEDLVREHFMTLVPPTDHKFAALHGAVWSGVPLCTFLRAARRNTLAVIFPGQCPREQTV